MLVNSLSLTLIESDTLRDPSQPPKFDWTYKRLCRDTLLYSEDKISSTRESRKSKKFLKGTMILESQTEEIFGTLT